MAYCGRYGEALVPKISLETVESVYVLVVLADEHMSSTAPLTRYARVVDGRRQTTQDIHGWHTSPPPQWISPLLTIAFYALQAHRGVRVPTQ